MTSLTETAGGRQVLTDRLRRAQPAGDEPATARSALKTRILLSGLAAPAAAVGLAVCVIGLATGQRYHSALLTIAVICALIIVVALIDIVVVRYRMRAGRRR